MTIRGDYVLGTHEAEVARLGRQHAAWREEMLAALRRAGLRPGSRVVDVGAGPGWATWDLAETVGLSGHVLAVERAGHFTAFLTAERARRRLDHVEVLEGDVTQLAPPSGYDLAWCRWVASFVPDVGALVNWIRGALRPGGRVVFHEYVDYASWRFAPRRPQLEAFVAEVMASWRAAGGEPDVAPEVLVALAAGGFEIRSTRPLVFATRPGELRWQWPAGFVATNVDRLAQLGRVSADWGRSVLDELREAEADPTSVMITPMVLEIIAERSSGT